jgi:hypothetical protein
MAKPVIDVVYGREKTHLTALNLEILDQGLTWTWEFTSDSLILTNAKLICKMI